MRASGGRRIGWEDIPAPFRARLESELGGRVVAATNEPGGFSPGLAARCRLADGRRVFIKAVSPEQNEHACRIHRREAEVATRVGALPHAPRLRHVEDDGRWVALVFDEIDGRQPQEPWRLDELDVVIPAIRAFTRSVTPWADSSLQTVAERHRAVFGGWRRFAGGDGDLSSFPDWVTRRLDRLVMIEDGWEDAAAGDSLVHADLRADNLLLTADGGVVIVDWPWACVGAGHADLVFLLPSIGIGGGPDVATVIDRYGLFEAIDPERFRSLFVAVAGFFARSCLDPAPKGLPAIRAFQRAQADVALAWLEHAVQ